MIVELNAKRGEIEQEEHAQRQAMEEYVANHYGDDEMYEEQATIEQESRSTRNRWTQFEQKDKPENDENNGENDCDDRYVLQIPDEYKKKKGRGRGRKRKYKESNQYNQTTKS